MYEQEIIKCLKNLSKQVWAVQQIMSNLDRDVRNMRVSGNTVVKTMPFGIKDISSVQLVDAYTRGLNMEQLIALGNQKYTAEQIYNKKGGGGRLMKAVVKHNGVELPESLCLVNTASNIVTLETMLEPNISLDLDKVYVEVNLFGDLEELED